MDTFTLIIWLLMGERFEETGVLNLSRAQCFELKLQIEGDRGRALGNASVPG